MESQRWVGSDGEQSVELGGLPAPALNTLSGPLPAGLPELSSTPAPGIYRSRDARDGYVDVAAEAERTRRALEEAQATTLRRKGRLLELHRRIAAAEIEEREAATAAAKAQLALDRVIGTATMRASAGPTPSKRRQCHFAVDTSRGRSLLGR